MALWALRCTILGIGPMELIKNRDARAWLKPSRRRRLIALAGPVATDHLF
jgi:hypothetical protein